MTLYDYQIKAIEELKNGSILCGGVGSGKSLTALGYFFTKVCGGDLTTFQLKRKMDLYIITTARKRDSKEWSGDLAKMILYPGESLPGVNVVIDSWNNVRKYEDIQDAFFLFDEQRVIGKGAWVRSFLKITKRNQWILLSATPADTYEDLIPVFVANGFYKNRTEFIRKHCIYKSFSKFPKIERYVGTKALQKHIDDIVVVMKDGRLTERIVKDVIVDYDKELYRTVFRDRWDPWENEPIAETGKLVYLTRKAVNSDPDRILKVGEILEAKKKCIVFYNHSYELEMLRQFCDENSVVYSEWNGQKHQEVPTGERWLYLVQYNAGCEAWNCISTDTMIFFSQNYSYRIMEQASGRIDRINTPYRHLYYYHLRSAAPIDRAIHRCLKEKRTFKERSFIKE